MHPSTVSSTYLHRTRNLYRRQMAGCADGGGKELHQISDSRYPRKFQPPESRHAATPSPLTTNSKCPSAPPPPPYFWTCFQQTASKYIHPESAATTEPQPYKREPDNWVSSRWNPTPEQLHTLKELYRSGTRTPTAKQIQQIAAKLRRFGKIEGKNVFYWFQNHKSRERQKHQRRINLGLKKQRSSQKQSGLTRTDFIVGHANYWASLSNSATSSEESVSLQRAVIAEGNTDIGIKSSEERERELRQSSSNSRKLTVDNIWQKIEMTPATTCTTAPETLLEVARSQKFSTETQLCNILLKPKHDNAFNQDLLEEDERRRRESHTLQLFPSPCNDVNIPNVEKDEAESPILTVNTNFTQIEFYELFPLNLKN